MTEPFALTSKRLVVTVRAAPEIAPAAVVLAVAHHDDLDPLLMGALRSYTRFECASLLRRLSSGPTEAGLRNELSALLE